MASLISAGPALLGLLSTGMVSRQHLSQFWNAPDLEDQERCVVRRLGPGAPGEYPGKVVGIYAPDADGHPDAYLVELDRQMPGSESFKVHVFPRGCVDSLRDLTLRDSHALTAD